MHNKLPIRRTQQRRIGFFVSDSKDQAGSGAAAVCEATEDRSIRFWRPAF
jgi:hypothetical protein